MRRLILAALAAAHLFGCASAAQGPPPSTAHDEPVAASEPRATVRLVVDLPPGSDCDETFDLALYAHRGVDLVMWDDPGPSCRARRLTIRYLPRRIERAALLERVRSSSARMEVDR